MKEHVLQIAICDDHPDAVSSLRDLVSSLTREMHIVSSVYDFYDAPSLLNHIDKMDMVFLDIDMPVMDGIETGHLVRSVNPECDIIIATGEVQRFKEAFSIRALRFITKPFDRQEVLDALKAAASTPPGFELMDLYQNRILYKIRQRDILFFRAFNGYVEASTKSGIYRKECTLNDIETSVDGRIFSRIHRSYLVNFYFVRSYDKKSISVYNTTLPLSRSNYTGFLRKFAAFEMEYSN